MKLLVDGEYYEYDFGTISVAEAMEMEERTGHGLLSLQVAWRELKPSAFKWLAYLARKRAGKRDNWDTFEFDLPAMVADLYPPDEDEDDDASDPTRPTSPASETPPAAPLPDVKGSTTSEASETPTSSA